MRVSWGVSRCPKPSREASCPKKSCVPAPISTYQRPAGAVAVVSVACLSCAAWAVPVASRAATRVMIVPFFIGVLLYVIQVQYLGFAFRADGRARLEGEKASVWYR